MVGDIEHLCSELDIELFRDSLDREVLQDREIHIEKARPVDAVPENVAGRQIRAPGLTGWRSRGTRETAAGVGQ